MSDTILVITLGGTMDAEPYREKNGEIEKQPNAIMLKQSVVPEIIANHPKLCADCRIEKLAPVDSKCVTPKQLENLLRLIESASEQRVVVCMGTDMLGQVAAHIQKRLSHMTKTVVFTGAFIPPSNDWDESRRLPAPPYYPVKQHASEAGIWSDGPNNIERSIDAARTTPPGVYVGIARSVDARGEWEIWPAGEKIKNLETWQFEKAAPGEADIWGKFSDVITAQARKNSENNR